MNRAYHHLTEKAIDCLSMAHCIAKNADYRPDIDAISAPLIQDGIKQLASPNPHSLSRARGYVRHRGSY